MTVFEVTIIGKTNVYDKVVIENLKKITNEKIRNFYMNFDL